MITVMNFANQAVSSPAGHLRLDLESITLISGAPAVVLATDDGTASREIACTGAAFNQCQRQMTPGGWVTEQSSTWTLTDGHQLRWTIGTLANGTGCTVRMAFRNGTQRPVRVRELISLHSKTPGITVTGDLAEWLLTTLAHSRRVGTLATQLHSMNDEERAIWAGFGHPVPYALPENERANNGQWRTFSDFALLAGPQGALAIGAVGTPEAAVRIACQVTPAGVRLEVASEMTDVVVAPGAWRAGQEIVILHGEQTDITERLMRWCAATHGARVHQPPAFGWCSWYHHGTGVAASDVIAIADHVRTTGLHMPVIQIDGGFQRQVGDWACNERFPAGWQPVISAIRAAGATPGIWLAPLAVHESTPIFAAHPEWIQRDVTGAMSGEANNWGPRSRWIDPTHPAAAQWIRELIRTHRAEGFRYFKIDFNTVGGISTQSPTGPRLHDSSKTSFQAMRELYRLYREEMGEDAYLLACIGFNRAVAGFADATRIGPDSASFWQAAHPCCIRDCIAAVGQNAAGNGILFANDPDVSYTRPRNELDVTSLRTWHGFVGLLGGLSLISEPLWQQDQQAGSARITLDVAGLLVELEAIDDDLRQAEPVWNGSSADIYVDREGKVGQWWLQPAVGTQPARAFRSGPNGPVLAPDLHVTSHVTDTGYHLRCHLPWTELKVTPTSEIRCEVKTSAVLGRSVPAVPRSAFTSFGSASPWASTRDYGVVRQGLTQELFLAARGWSGTDRNYELIVPPIPEHGRSFAPRDPDHQRFGFQTRRAWGDFTVVQLSNVSESPRAATLDTTTFFSGPCHVWSFWDGVDMGVHTGIVTVAQLPPRGSAVLRITPITSSLPQLVGSDLHLGIGAAEIISVDATADHITIHLKPGAGARSGTLWLAQAAHLSHITATGLTITDLTRPEAQNPSGLIGIHISQRSHDAQTITLSRR